MSDHFKFLIYVEMYDRSELEDSQKERGDEIKEECAKAVRETLQRLGFKEYRHEFWVHV